MTPVGPVQDWRKRFPGLFETALFEANQAIARLRVDHPDIIPISVANRPAFQAAVEAAFNRGAQAIADVVTGMFEKLVL